MVGFGQLLREAPRLLGFGFLLTFFSRFGHTFLLSLDVPALFAYLGLSQGWMGALTWLLLRATDTTPSQLRPKKGGADASEKHYGPRFSARATWVPYGVCFYRINGDQDRSGPRHFWDAFGSDGRI